MPVTNTFIVVTHLLTHNQYNDTPVTHYQYNSTPGTHCCGTSVTNTFIAISQKNPHTHPYRCLAQVRLECMTVTVTVTAWPCKESTPSTPHRYVRHVLRETWQRRRQYGGTAVQYGAMHNDAGKRP